MTAPEQAAGPGYPVRVELTPAIADRNRLTTGFRIILAIPHLILVGGPLAATASWSWGSDYGENSHLTVSGGVLGVVACVIAVIAWFAILFTGRYPAGLRDLAVFYLRWRVRAVAYTALLRDEYPPFGEGAYPASLEIAPPAGPRNRVTVAFRVFLAIPQLLAVWALGVAWALTTMIGWFAILFTGRYPAGLYQFGVGVLRWNTRVEAYLLLLCDEYPPFSLRS
jgi:hypothetical protein